MTTGKGGANGVAATTLASLVSADRVTQGAIYPPVADLRRVSRAVATQARQDGVARLAPGDDIDQAAGACDPLQPRLGNTTLGVNYQFLPDEHAPTPPPRRRGAQ